MVIVVMFFTVKVAMAAIIIVPVAPETPRRQAARNADKDQRENRALHYFLNWVLHEVKLTA